MFKSVSQLFILLINVKMPTTVGVLTLMSRINFMRMKKVLKPWGPVSKKIILFFHFFQQKLLTIIDERRDEKKYAFPKKVESLSDVDDVFINNHLLLFTSALVPKALSSVLTSFVIEIAKRVCVFSAHVLFI